MANSIKVSLVVLNWNGKRLIDPFFKSLSRVKIPKGYKLEKLFIDNASSDKSVEYVKDNYKDVKVVQNNDNYGYAKGNNLGFKQASGDFILVTNNDVTFDKDWLVNLLGVAEKLPDYDAFVSKLVYADNKAIINNAGSKIVDNSTWPTIEIGANQKASLPEFNKDYDVSAMCGANILFRRRFLEEVGLFDSRFFMYFEDSDLSWRGQKLGKKYRYVHKSVVYHEHAATSQEGSTLFNFYVARNRLLILMKNAKIKYILKGWGRTLIDQFFTKVVWVIKSIKSGSGRRNSLSYFVLGQKVIWSAIWLTPYTLLKRWGIIKEDRL